MGRSLEGKKEKERTGWEKKEKQRGKKRAQVFLGPMERREDSA